MKTSGAAIAIGLVIVLFYINIYAMVSMIFDALGIK